MEIDKQISKETQDTVVIYYFTGDIDLYNAPRLRSALVKDIEANNYNKIIIHLGKVEFMDSSGISILGSIFARLKKTGCVRLCELTKSVLDILKLTALTNFFIIDTTLDEALKNIIDYKI